MSTVQPKGEALKNAIKWLSEKRTKDPAINLSNLVDEAGFRFDLTPRDCEFLQRFVQDDPSQDPA